MMVMEEKVQKLLHKGMTIDEVASILDVSPVEVQQIVQQFDGNSHVIEPLLKDPEDVCCPITSTLMHDPVAASDGRWYERKAIAEAMERTKGKDTPHGRSPMTNQPLASGELIGAPLVRQLVQTHAVGMAQRILEVLPVFNDEGEETTEVAWKKQKLCSEGVDKVASLADMLCGRLRDLAPFLKDSEITHVHVLEELLKHRQRRGESADAEQVAVLQALLGRKEYSSVMKRSLELKVEEEAVQLSEEQLRGLHGVAGSSCTGICLALAARCSARAAHAEAWDLLLPVYDKCQEDSVGHSLLQALKGMTTVEQEAVQLDSVSSATLEGLARALDATDTPAGLGLLLKTARQRVTDREVAFALEVYDRRSRRQAQGAMEELHQLRVHVEQLMMQQQLHHDNTRKLQATVEGLQPLLGAVTEVRSSVEQAKVGVGQAKVGLVQTKTDYDALVASVKLLQQKTAAQAQRVVPSGCIVAWYGKNEYPRIPAGWVLCDGDNGTPDLKGRFIRGYTAGYPVGSVGGQSQVKLRIDQMPEHQHQIASSGWDRKVARTAGDTTSAPDLQHEWREDWEAPDEDTFMTSPQGDSSPINILPPFCSLFYIMKV